MTVLVDTHVLLWVVLDSPKLPVRYREALLDVRNRVLVSAASVWEVAIKTARGRLDVDLDELVEAIENSGFDQLPVTAVHATATRRLPDLHRDPFDRILAAQALTERAHLATVDDQLLAYTDVTFLEA